MDVFVSWSGELSRRVAAALAWFIERVVPAAFPFVSSHDIEAGELWEGRLTGEMEGTHYAVLCLTRDNQQAPWINYEAGTIGKLVTRARVVPYAIGFPPNEVEPGPLRRFQGVRNDEPGTWQLVSMLSRATERQKSETFVREGFERWWPDFLDEMSRALADAPTTSEQSGPSDHDLLLEVRESVQRLIDLSTLGTANVGAAIELLQSAVVDPLSGLANMRALTRRGFHLAAVGAPYVVALMDVDEFKRLNDRYGHHVGDRVLLQLALALKKHFSAADIVARYGGDEFAIIFREQPPDSVAHAISEFALTLSGTMATAGLPEVTISTGVSSDRGEPFESKLEDADAAMYQAKQQSGNSVRVA